MQIRLYINSIDRTANLKEKDLTIEDNIGNIIDTFAFTIIDLDRSLNSVIYEGLDVIIEKFSDATVRLFGGIIVEKETELDGLGLSYRLTCQDWRTLVDKATFTKQYVSTTDLAIIQDAFTEAGLTEIITNNASFTFTGRIFDVMEFVGTSLSSMLDQIADATGYVWYIDKFKNLHYHPFHHHKSTSILEFSDVVANLSSSIIPFNGIKHIKRMGEFNAVEVRGYVRLSSNVTQTYKNDGTHKTFNLTSDPYASVSGNSYQPISREPSTATDDLIDVYVNASSNLNEDLDISETGVDVVSGAAYATNDVILIDLEQMLVTNVAANTLTVTRGYNSTTAATHTNGTAIFIDQKVVVRRADKDQFTDDATIDVIWNPLFVQVEFRTAPPNNATNSWKVVGRYQSPSVALMRDEAAIQRANGREFRYVMNETLVRTEEQALDVAKAFLREQGPKELIEIEFLDDGLQTCQSVYLTSTPLGITRRKFLITQLTIEILGGDVNKYHAILEYSHTLFDQEN